MYIPPRFSILRYFGSGIDHWFLFFWDSSKFKVVPPGGGGSFDTHEYISPLGNVQNHSHFKPTSSLPQLIPTSTSTNLSVPPSYK